MLNRQPNSNHCFVCGRFNPRGLYMRFYDNGQDEVYAQHTIPAEYQGYPGIVHGGIVAAILDEVVGRVSMIGDPHHFMMSVRLEVKYRRPVPIETPLKIVGRVLKLRGWHGKAMGEIYLPDGLVAAQAEMTLADLPAGMPPPTNNELAGWYVDEQG